MKLAHEAWGLAHALALEKHGRAVQRAVRTTTYVGRAAFATSILGEIAATV